MTARINSLTGTGDTDALRALVRDFLADELRQLRAVSGLEPDLDALVSGTFDHIADYLPPRGRVLVAQGADGALQGCVFLKMIRPDAAEIKRLFVRPSARGTGLGRRLTEHLIRDARDLGAARVLLDTGIYDTAAHALYDRLGFRRIGPYPESENDAELEPYLLYFQLDL